MKEILLKSGLKLLVDDDDYDHVMQYKWWAGSVGKANVYAIAHKRIDGVRRTFLLHRLVLNAKSGEMVDHINGDGLDNRKENLRLCTPSQNSANRRAKRGNIKGIWRSREGKWVAQVGYSVNGKKHKEYVGTFETQEEAAHAYDLVAEEHHKEFTKLNFPRGK